MVESWRVSVSRSMKMAGFFALALIGGEDMLR